MKISTKGRYALRMMLDMAQNQKNGPVALKDIAERQNVSKKYLEQIALILSQEGILQGTRGHQGGYRMVARSSRSSRAPCIPWPAWIIRLMTVSAAMAARRSSSGKAWTR